MLVTIQVLLLMREACYHHTPLALFIKSINDTHPSTPHIHLRHMTNKYLCDTLSKPNSTGLEFLSKPKWLWCLLHHRVRCFRCWSSNALFYQRESSFALYKQSLIWGVVWGSRWGNKNANGLSRDHKVSVNEAKKYNYNQYYISHPLNCELMLHIKNNKKKTKSSISYTQLLKLVDDYDNGSSNENLTRSVCATNTSANITPYST